MTDRNSSRNRASDRLIAGWVAVAAVFVLFAAASFLPDKRLWGLNHLAFYPGHWRFLVLALTAVFLLPPAAELVSRGAGRVGRAWLRGLDDGSNTLALTAVVSFVVFAAFRSATRLLGDGHLVFNNFRSAAENGLGPIQFFSQVTLAEKIYPGAEFLNYLASWGAGRFGASPAGGVWILNCAIGSLVLVALMTVVRRLEWPDGARLAALGLVVATGALQLFFGYIEHYAAPFALGVLYLLSVARSLKGRRFPLVPGLILTLGIIFHVQMTLLGPSWVWLLLRNKTGRGGAVRSFRFAVTVAAITIAAGVAACFFDPVRSYVLPLSGDGYTVFSGAHLLDSLNILLLLCPALPLIAVFTLRRTASPDPRDAGGSDLLSFAVVTGVPAWMFVLLFRPELGMARDWDLYAITFLGLAAPGIALLFRHVMGDGNPRRFVSVLVPAVVVSAAVVISWIGVNASAQRSVDRYRAILQYDTTSPGYAYENLALYYQENYQYTLQIEALEKAYSLSQNPRLLLKLGRVYNENNNPGRAEDAMRRYLAQVPESREARVWLLRQLARRADVDEMIQMSLDGLKYSPRVPDYYFFLGNAYLAKGKTKEGLEAFEICSRLNPPPVMVKEMKRLTEQADRRIGPDDGETRED